MKRAAILALRCLLGLFFLAAGLSKVGAPLQTLAAVYSYQIVLPDGLALALAYALPWVEVTLGLALLSGFFLPLTLAATAALLLAFTVLTAQAGEDVAEFPRLLQDHSPRLRMDPLSVANGPRGRGDG